MLYDKMKQYIASATLYIQPRFFCFFYFFSKSMFSEYVVIVLYYYVFLKFF